MALFKNQSLELTIDGMSADGSGVGHTESRMAVFVPGTVSGERVWVKIVKVHKTYAFAILEAVLSPSPFRLEPDCAQSQRCGGCVYRHMAYEEELRMKWQKVRDALHRIGGLSVVPGEIVGADSPLRYRNKAQLPVGRDENGRTVIGFYAPHSHRIIPCGDCLLQPKVFTDIMNEVRDFLEENHIPPYDEATGKGLVRHLYLRRGHETHEIMVCLVINGGGFPQEEAFCRRLTGRFSDIRSIVLNRNTRQSNLILGPFNRTLYGRDFIMDRLCGLTFAISPHSFYQVNPPAAQRLYELAAGYAALTGEETVLDLYCGTGTIGLSMAERAKEIIGVELVPQAVENALKNAESNGIANARFLCAEASEAVQTLKQEGLRPDVVVVDPPRKGCGPDVLDAIAALAPQRVVYVSCDPATLARDLKLLLEKGYEAAEVTPVDMFPRTGHVETCCLLRKAL